MQDFSIFLKVSTRHSLIVKSPSTRVVQRKLLYFKKSRAGRNSSGRITVSHKGGGTKKLHRYIDSNRKIGSHLFVVNVERCPIATRSCFVALVTYPFGVLSYILAPEGLQKGDILYNYSSSDLRRNVMLEQGYSAPIRCMRAGLNIFDVAVVESGGGIFARSAGTSCVLRFIDYQREVALIQLPSKRFYKISMHSRATLGRASNVYHKRQVLGTAGRKRRAGVRPTVRGVAMNPVDHPHGGGEGKRASGRPSVSPWGWLTKGKPTVSKKRKIQKARQLSIFKQYIRN
jgi:large subunit ribosomal protein L2|tara:strand:- start:3731 stop:4591 length:861 start_codon:yes stop_codon:yes gene_type:complete